MFSLTTGGISFAGNNLPPTPGLVTCEIPVGVKVIPLPKTYLYFEHNSTAGDTGIHGLFDSNSFVELCIYDPNGNQILAVKPQNQLKDLTMAGIFFESREPEHETVPIERHFKNFPEGFYKVRGVAYDGTGYDGAAWLTHNIPKPPKMIFPLEMADQADINKVIIRPHNVVIKWEPVTETIFGKPVKIDGYQVIVKKLPPTHPHGFAHPNYEVWVRPSVTSLSIPNEFWEPNTGYEFEVLAIEESGNQTLVSGFFKTGKKRNRYDERWSSRSSTEDQEINVREK